MKKTMLLLSLLSALLGAPFSYAIIYPTDNDITLKVFELMLRVYEPNQVNDDGLTLLQQLLTLSASESKAEEFFAKHVEKLLIFGANPNIINPLTGGTALFDRVRYHDKTSENNRFIKNIKSLINYDARLDNIDSQGHSFYNVIEQARADGRISQEEYDQILAIPAVREHVQDLQNKAQHLSDTLEDLLPVQSLHSIVADYTYGVPH